MAAEGRGRRGRVRGIGWGESCNTLKFGSFRMLIGKIIKQRLFLI
jgi:hypothetical protein